MSTGREGRDHGSILTTVSPSRPVVTVNTVPSINHESLGFFLLFFRPVSFASLALSPSFVLAGPYPVVPCHGFGGRGRCTLPFRRWSSVFTFICTRTGVQTDLNRHDWKEWIHLTPLSNPLLIGACAVRWMAGWSVCVLCHHLATHARPMYGITLVRLWRTQIGKRTYNGRHTCIDGRSNRLVYPIGKPSNHPGIVGT